MTLLIISLAQVNPQSILELQSWVSTRVVRSQLCTNLGIMLTNYSYSDPYGSGVDEDVQYVQYYYIDTSLYGIFQLISNEHAITSFSNRNE